MRKFFLVLVPLFLLGACGDESPSNDKKPVNAENRYYSRLVEADGVTYRCFEMGYNGGLWCTVKPGSR